MTTNVSHVFYESEEPRENDMVYRITVTEKKLTVLFQEMYRAFGSKKLVEKPVMERTYELKHNTSGVPYLTILETAAGSKTRDVAFAMSSSPFSVIWRQTEAADFIESEVLGWFSDTIKPLLDESDEYDFGLCLDLLLFPALRDESMSGYSLPARVRPILENLATDISCPVLHLLREESSWDGFLKSISFPETVPTDDDVAFLRKYLYFMGFATMNLGGPISEVGKGLASAALALREDFPIFKFMFTYLSPKGREAALQALRDMSLNSKIYIRTDFSSLLFEPLDSLPEDKREELAEIILSSLQEKRNYILSEEGERERDTSSLTESVMPVLKPWLWENVTKPQLRTETTVEQIEEKFIQLFGIPFPRNVFRLRETGELLFYQYLPPLYKILHGADKIMSEDVFISELMASEKAPLGGPEEISGYVDNTGKFIEAGQLYSLGDVLDCLVNGVFSIDTDLKRLGRKVTPSSRLEYLSMGCEERKMQSVWRLYDLGVTKSKRIRALLEAEIHTKSEILLYNELPDDMFNELVKLHSDYSSEDMVWA